MTLLEWLDRFPPCLCRLVARKGRGHSRLSQMEIAIKSGLSLSYVSELSGRNTWRGIRAETITAFSLACGVNLFALKQQRRLLNHTTLLHVRRAKRSEKRVYARIQKSLHEYNRLRAQAA